MFRLGKPPWPSKKLKEFTAVQSSVELSSFHWLAELGDRYQLGGIYHSIILTISHLKVPFYCIINNSLIDKDQNLIKDWALAISHSGVDTGTVWSGVSWFNGQGDSGHLLILLWAY